MYQTLISGFLAGVMTFACIRASAQETVPLPDSELFLGTGLSKEPYLSSFAPENPLLPSILLKKARKNSVRRYSFRMRIDNNYENEQTDPLDQLIDDVESSFFLNLAFGVGSEWRFKLGKKVAFYSGGEFSTRFAFERNRRFRASYNLATNDSGFNEFIYSDFVPSLGVDVFAGFRLQPLPRISLSVEAGPGIFAFATISKSVRKLGENLGTPAENLFSDTGRDGQIGIRAGFLTPLFVAAGFSF